MNLGLTNITGKQCKAARALLGWHIKDLAKQADINPMTIVRFENDEKEPRSATVEKIERALLQAGIEFGPNNSVKEKSDRTKTLIGRDGFVDFLDDVYDVIKNTRADIYISGVDEAMFWNPIFKPIIAAHAKRMSVIKDRFDCLCFIREGDQNENKVDYAEYRSVPDYLFSNVPFYIYGSKLAIILWQEPVQIIIIDNIALTEAYRKQFEFLWQTIAKPTGGQ